MNLKQADLGRESVVGARQLRGRTLQIRAAYINRLKALTAVAFLLIVVLLVTVFQLNKRHDIQAAENNRLNAQVAQLQGQISDEAAKMELVAAQSDSTSSKALTYIEGIQAKLGKINTYLNKRGLHGISFKAAKAVKKTDKKNGYVDLYKKYNRYLDKMVDNIAMMPMGYPRVSDFTSYFGYRSNPFNFGRNEFHPGLDFKGRMGEPVKSTASGKVVFAGRAGGYGNCVRIRHTDGIETWYGHLSRMLVREGQKVNVGQLIGKVGSTGRSTGPHLHYEVRRNGKAVNPKQYLSLNE
ncbi:M23 family metallopeptidase [Mucilaginibacter sp. PAMB04274]|uniref:M23 family metallopeptidase n=1 Tax=Mucilaginibacter sp. PAMB04274 TaxID=3138568 RepID=UPI0031F6F0A7